MQVNYNIRRATEADIPAIIELFELSLGSEGGAPVESFWRWKHIDNPFGVSPVLLGVDENDKLIGLRAFMRWKWRYNDTVYPAFRPVDTATHPDYRGKGIFSKLTKQLIKELSESEPSSFIYNTPNDQSKPGYIKMGWQVLGKAPVVATVKLAVNRSAPKKFQRFNSYLNELDFTNIELFPVKDKITRDNSVKYLKWRYRDIPELQYGCYKYSERNKQAYIFFHLKNRKNLFELRICDYAGVDPKKDAQMLVTGFKKLAAELGTPVITFCNSIPFTRWEKIAYIINPITKLAPEITVRNVNDEKLFNEVNDINKWSFAMGDLELF
jgi:GNAT superfamily N-acetyltransferase